MIRLLALRAFIPVWARAIALSDKLSEKTWKILVILQCVIFILSAGGFGESQSGPVFSHVTDTLVPVDSKSLLSSDTKRHPGIALTRKRPRASAKIANVRSHRKAGRNSAPSVAALRLYTLKREYVRRTRRPLIVTSFRRSPAQQARAIHNSVVAGGFADVLSFSRYSPAIREEVATTAYGANHIMPGDALSHLFPDLRKFVGPARSVTVQLSQLDDEGDYKKTLLFWVSLFGLIVSPISTASTIVVAWISVHRGRADELLKDVQIEKMRLEVQQLRLELERARLEAERHQSRIVIAAE